MDRLDWIERQILDLQGEILRLEREMEQIRRQIRMSVNAGVLLTGKIDRERDTGTPQRKH